MLEDVTTGGGGNEGRATMCFGVGQDPPPWGTDTEEREDDSNGGCGLASTDLGDEVLSIVPSLP